MKLVKLFASLLMVFTLGVSQASGQCSCMEVVNNSNCEINFELRCKSGATLCGEGLNEDDSETECASGIAGCSDIVCVGFSFNCSPNYTCFDCSNSSQFKEICCGDGTKIIEDCAGVDHKVSIDCSTSPCQVVIN